MKKGTSNTILSVLILFITLSLALLLYSWLSQNSAQVQSEMGGGISNGRGCLKIENIDVKTKVVSVRNCGDTVLEIFTLYIDSEPVAEDTGGLLPGGIKHIAYTSDLPYYQDHEIFVSSNKARTASIRFSAEGYEIDNVVAFWGFDDASGFTALDSSGNGHDGLLTNMEETDWLSGAECISDSCLNFDGVNEYVSVADSPDLDFGTSSFSISSWFKTSSSATYQLILSKQNPVGPWQGYSLWVRDGGKIWSELLDSSGGQRTRRSSSAVNDGMWHFVVASYNRSDDIRIFIDGAEASYEFSQGSMASVGSIDSSYPVLIGQRGGGQYFFNGTIDKVKIYGKALTQSEALYEMIG